jgi:hypothetical protein
MSAVADTASHAAIKSLEELAALPPEKISIEKRIQLCRECAERVVQMAPEWVRLEADVKGLPTGQRAEAVLSGPSVVLRQLRLSIQTLSSVLKNGRPTLPGKTRTSATGQLAVPVFPTTGFFDSMVFAGLTAEVHMQPGVQADQLHGDHPEHLNSGRVDGIALVLGAGNEVMGPLVNAGLLRIVTGGGDVGATLVRDDRVTEIHVTGSVLTHDAIVWGTGPGETRPGQPITDKCVTSELGNVTPWIVVPARYSGKELSSQAQHLAASITNNVSFNCIATTRRVSAAAAAGAGRNTHQKILLSRSR